MRWVFQHNVYGKILKEISGIMKRNMYIKYLLGLAHEC
jgi:hypothetical protein